MIRIELQAETAEEMAQQIRTLLTIGIHLPSLKAVQEELKPDPQDLASLYPEPTNYEPQTMPDPTLDERLVDGKWVSGSFTEPKKPAPKVKAKKPEPVPIEETIEDLPEEEPVHENLKDALALNKLKEETLGRLKDLFVAGKGKYIRTLLQKHGHGAMVFPEVEAKYFPAIKAEIDKEIGA